MEQQSKTRDVEARKRKDLCLSRFSASPLFQFVDDANEMVHNGMK